MSEQARPAGERAAFLRIERVTKEFGAFAALREVSLEIHEGEFVCFLGPSGCGKTTLLRAIAGLDIQTRGRIIQNGRDISGLPPAMRDFGIVFQSYALFPNLTVRGNVAYGLKNRGMRRAATASRVAELLMLVGLSGSEDKFPAQLSGGQQQRIALARALAPAPSLLLLDEPLSALDARVRIHLRQEIKHLQRRLGVTTIMVTHDQEEALVMADRIVVMNHGMIEQVGVPLEIYRAPASPFVANFVGTMNFLPGILVTPDRVRIGTAEIALGAALADAPGGAAVTLCLRPEDVGVRNVDGAARNTVAAEIAELEFLGSFYRASLSAAELGNGGLLADFSINAVRDLGLEAGRKLPITLPPDRLRVFLGSELPANAPDAV